MLFNLLLEKRLRTNSLFHYDPKRVQLEQKLKAIDRTTLFARKQRTIIPLVCDWYANWMFRILRYNFANFRVSYIYIYIFIYQIYIFVIYIYSLMHAWNSSSNFHSSYINYRIFIRWSPRWNWVHSRRVDSRVRSTR